MRIDRKTTYTLEVNEREMMLLLEGVRVLHGILVGVFLGQNREHDAVKRAARLKGGFSAEADTSPMISVMEATYTGALPADDE